MTPNTESNSQHLQAEQDCLQKLKLPANEVIQKINRKLSEIGYDSPLFIIDPPEELIASLAGKKILMIDDSKAWLRLWLPTLMLATNGSADYFLHQNHINTGGILKAIGERQPDVILLDYRLAGQIIRKQVAEHIEFDFPEVKIIGFSSEPQSNTIFQSIGLQTLDKSANDPIAVLRQLANYLS